MHNTSNTLIGTWNLKHFNFVFLKNLYSTFFLHFLYASQCISTNKNLWILVVSVETWKHSTTASELWLPFAAVGTGRLPGRTSCRFSPAEPRSTRCHELSQQLHISWSLFSLLITVQSTASWLLIGCCFWTRSTPSCSENDDRRPVKRVLLSFDESGADESDLSGFCSVESRLPALTSVESFLQRHNSNYNK